MENQLTISIYATFKDKTYDAGIELKKNEQTIEAISKLGNTLVLALIRKLDREGLIK